MSKTTNIRMSSQWFIKQGQRFLFRIMSIVLYLFLDNLVSETIFSRKKEVILVCDQKMLKLKNTGISMIARTQLNIQNHIYSVGQEFLESARLFNGHLLNLHVSHGVC